MDRPFVLRCEVRRSVCVVLPDLSRPSMTMNAPRAMITVLMISKVVYSSIDWTGLDWILRDANRVRDSESEVLLFRSFQMRNWIGTIVLLLISPSRTSHARTHARTHQATLKEEKFAPPIDPLVYASSL
jgi:hypothetical protein